MKSFDNGVGYYTHGKLSVPFPEDDVCCAWCRYCKLGKSIDKQDYFYCAVNNRVICINPRTDIADFCPLEFEEAEDEV